MQLKSIEHDLDGRHAARKREGCDDVTHFKSV
jgi:hypothetical protein